MFRQWTFYIKQRTLLLIVGDCFSLLNNVLTKAGNLQPHREVNSVSTVHPFHNRQSGPFPGKVMSSVQLANFGVAPHGEQDLGAMSARAAFSTEEPSRPSTNGGQKESSITSTSPTGLLKCVGLQGGQNRASRSSVGTVTTSAMEIPDDPGLSYSGCNQASAPWRNCTPQIMHSTCTVWEDSGADTVRLQEPLTEPSGVDFQPRAAPYAEFVDYEGITTDVFGDERFGTRAAPYAGFADWVIS